LKITRKLVAFLMVVSLVAVLSCSSGSNAPPDSQPQEPAYAGAIAEDILQAMNSGDYASFSQYFDDVMKKTIPEDTFRQYRAVYHDRIGTYESKTYWETTIQDRSQIVEYKARFTQEPADVIVSIAFTQVDGQVRVSWLYFMSPKVRGYT
jgi:hypothetical protein